MTESEAIEKLKNMRLFMQITDKNSENKFAEDDYKVNEIAIQALEKQIPKKPIIQKTDEKSLYKCPCCTKIFFEAYENTQRGYIPKFCEMCGQSINFRLE